MSGFCARFAGWGADAAVPEPVREEARRALLDTLGCMIAGWDEPQTRAARAAFAGEETATAAALVLGTAAHALDFDDYEVPGSTHPGAPVLGALLGLLSRAPQPLGAVLDAHAVGYEAIVRLGEAMRYDHYDAGWHSTGTLGTVGAAAASARLLGLPADAFARSLAISASLAGGLKAQFGTDAKALHAGLAARAGVEAARLAAAGATGAGGVFEGRFGFARMHHGAAEPSDTRRFGAPFGLVRHAPLRKPWPCCAYTHRAIDAALALHPRLPGPPAWERVTIRMPEPFFRVAGFLRPANASEARFSTAYCALAALLDGAVGPESFAPAAVLRPEIGALLARTEIDAYDPGPGIEDMSPAHPDTVTVALAGGEVLSHTVRHVPGGPDRPMDAARLAEKFAACGGDAATEALIRAAGPATRLCLRLGGEGPLLAAAPGTA